MGEIADFVGSTPDGGARGGEALIGVGLGVRRMFGQVAQAPGSNGGRKGVSGVSTSYSEYSRIFHPNARSRKKKGDRCSLQNFLAASRHFEKKGRTRWHIFHPRMIHLFVWIRSHKFVSDDRSVAKTGGEIEYPHGNPRILRRIWTRVSRLENGGVAAASARGLSPDVYGVHIVAVVGGGCPRLLLQEHRHRPALVRSLIVDGVE